MRLRSSFFLFSLIFVFGFGFPAKADCTTTLESLSPFFSGAEAAEIALMQSYVTRLNAELSRSWDAASFSEKEIAEIHAWGAIPDFADNETTVKIYNSQVDFLLRGIERKLVTTTSRKIMATLNVSRVVENTQRNLANWNARAIDSAVKAHKTSLTPLIGTLLLRGATDKINELALTRLLTIHYLLSLHGTALQQQSASYSHMSILGSAVEEKNVKQLEFTLLQVSPTKPGEIRRWKSDEAIIEHANSLLPGLRAAHQKASDDVTALENEVAVLAEPLALVSEKTPSSIASRLNDLFRGKSYEAQGCCGRGCSHCGYMSARYLTVLQDTAKTMPTLPPQALPEGLPTLALFQAERELSALLPASLFKLHRTPSSYQAALNEIK